MNNELMEQCRKEAEEVYPTAIPGIIDDWQRTLLIQAYAAALYNERSKRRELTDDMIETAGAIEHRMYLQETCSDEQAEIEAEIWSKGVMSGLRQARDNGYLSTGLTVERVMEVVKAWHNYSDLSPKEAENLMMNETPEEAYDNLRARLTEAAKH